MTNEKTKSRSSDNVTVERSGARSVNLGQVLTSTHGREQLRQVGKIEESQAPRSRKK